MSAVRQGLEYDAVEAGEDGRSERQNSHEIFARTLLSAPAGPGESPSQMSLISCPSDLQRGILSPTSCGTNASEERIGSRFMHDTCRDCHSHATSTNGLSFRQSRTQSLPPKPRRRQRRRPMPECILWFLRKQRDFEQLHTPEPPLFAQERRPFLALP